MAVKTTTYTPAHRWSGREVVELLEGVIAQLTQPRNIDHSSVAIKRGAQGQVLIEVQVRTDPGGRFKTPAQASSEAERLYRGLVRKFPAPKPASSRAGK